MKEMHIQFLTKKYRTNRTTKAALDDVTMEIVVNAILELQNNQEWLVDTIQILQENLHKETANPAVQGQKVSVTQKEKKQPPNDLFYYFFNACPYIYAFGTKFTQTTRGEKLSSKDPTFFP